MSLQVGFKCRKQIYCYSPFSSIIYFDCLSTSLTETTFAFYFIWVPLLAVRTGFLHNSSLFALKVTIYICWISKLAIRDMTFWNKKKDFGTVLKRKFSELLWKNEVFGNVLKENAFRTVLRKKVCWTGLNYKTFRTGLKEKVLSSVLNWKESF
mgnify:CR=1 FL=1